jgi:hypothetical protein
MQYKVYHIRHISDKRVVYVGLTKGYLSARFSSHLKDERRNKKKVNYFRCHKKDLEIVSVYDGIESLSKANQLEKDEIKRLKDLGVRLLNATEGGDGTKGFTSWNSGVKCYYIDKIIKSSPNLKKVYCYDLEGNFIEEFRSIKYASIKTKCTRVAISNIAKQSAKYKQSKGFQFRFYKQDKIDRVTYNDEYRIQKAVKAIRDKSKKILCLDLLSGQAKEFCNIFECEKELFIKKGSIYASIRADRNCFKKYKFQFV